MMHVESKSSAVGVAKETLKADTLAMPPPSEKPLSAPLKADTLAMLPPSEKPLSAPSVVGAVQMLEAIYDPDLDVFYDPRSNQYYERRHGDKCHAQNDLRA